MSSLRSSTKFSQDEDGTIQTEIGKTTWENGLLESNIKELVKSVGLLKPAKLDTEKYIQSVCVYSKFSPALVLPKKPFRVVT
jgi:ribosomal protein L1